MRDTMATVTCDQCGAEATPSAGDWTVDCPQCFTRLAVCDTTTPPEPENRSAPDDLAGDAGVCPASAAGVSDRARPQPRTAPRCRHHGDTPAVARCDRCQATLCEACVTGREVQRIEIEMCACGGRAVRLSESERGVAPAPARQLGSAFGFPFVEPGRTMMIAGGLFLAAAAFLASISMLGFFIEFFVAGFLCAYLMKVVSATTVGEDTPPDWPSVESIWSSVTVPFLRIGAVTALYLGPACAAAIYFGPLSPFTALALVGGCFLLPMALLALAVYRTVAAMNPVFLAGSIARAPSGYVQTTGLLLLAVVTSWVAQSIGGWLPWIGPPISHTISLYLLMVTGRMLGLHYRLHADELDWF